MKPFPDLEDAEAVAKRGRMSLLASARNEAEASLRDTYTWMTGSTWDDLPPSIARLREAIDRLQAISDAHKRYFSS